MVRVNQAVPGAADADSWALAPLGRRFGALLIDWLLCVLIANLVADPVQESWYPVLILIAEYGFFLGAFGQTPGMWCTRIGCVRISDGRPLGVPAALLRGVLLALLIPALIMDAQRRGLHDRATGSIVVAAPRRGSS